MWLFPLVQVAVCLCPWSPHIFTQPFIYLKRKPCSCAFAKYLCITITLMAFEIFFHSFTLCVLNDTVVIIIIAFIGAIRDFLQSPLCAANRLQHARSSGPDAIVCKSRAKHRALITCNMSCYVPRGTKGQLSY